MDTQAIPPIEQYQAKGNGTVEVTVSHWPECAYWSGDVCNCQPEIKAVDSINEVAAMLGVAQAIRELNATFAALLADRDREVTFKRNPKGDIVSARIKD